MASRTPRSKSLDLVVAGHTNIDHFLYTRRLPERDRTVPCEREVTRLGGTAANLGRVAARLGLRVRLLSLVGADFPETLERLLHQDGVDLKGLRRVPGTVTTTCHIVEDGKGGQMTLLRPGAMDEVSRLPNLADWLGDAPWVHLCTGNPAFMMRLKEDARDRGVRVAIDPAQEVHYRWTGRALREYLSGAEILFGNEHEARRVAELIGAHSIGGLLEHVPLVIVTAGRRGATAYSRAGTFRAPAGRIRKVRNVTGAGDAFRAGFYLGWTRGDPLVACLATGNRIAAGWLGRPG